MKYIIGSLIALVALLTPSVSQVNFGGPGGSFGGVFDAALNYLSGTVSDGCAEWSSNQLTSTGSDCNSGGSFGQVFELTTNTFSQSAVAPTTTQNLLINGTGTSTFAGGLEVWRQIAAPYFQATSTTATSSFDGFTNFGGADAMTVSGTSILSTVQIHASDGATQAELELDRHGDTAGAGSTLFTGRSRGTITSPTIVQSGDRLFGINVTGYDGTDNERAAAIRFSVDGTPGANDMPGRITFHTTPDNSSSLSERLRITNAGLVGIATTSPYKTLSIGGDTVIGASTAGGTLGNLYVPTLTSALTLTGADGLFAEYTGTSCTNQFVRSLSALGVATCETVANTDLANSTISGISLGSNLADLTATDTTLTFSGAYNGGTARTVGLNLGNANTWTALQTFGNSTTTLASFDYASSTLYYGAGLQTCNATTGKLAWANGQFTCETDQAGGSSFGQAWEEFASGFIAPTSTAGVAVGATTTYNGTSLFQVNATNTTQTLISASTTASYAGDLLRFNDSSNSELFAIDFAGNASTTGISTTGKFFAAYGGDTNTPSYVFSSNNGTGIGSSNGGQINLIVGGTRYGSITNNGYKAHLSGTAASPVYSSSASTGNYGLYFPSGGGLNFTAAGTEAGVIDSSQRWGIGSTTPGTLLSIGGNATGINFVDGATATSTFSGYIEATRGFFSSFMETVSAIVTNITISGNFTLNGDTITDLDNDSTLSIVSSALRVVDLICNNCIGGTEIDESTLTIPSGSYASASIDGDDINSNIAGRSLTLTAGSPDTLDADAELYTFNFTANLVATSSNQIATSTTPWLSKRIHQAGTITGVYCKAYDAGTSTVRIQINGSTDVLYGTGINCGADENTASTTLQNTSLTAGDYLEVFIQDAEPTGSRPRLIPVDIAGTWND